MTGFTSFSEFRWGERRAAKGISFFCARAVVRTLRN